MILKYHQFIAESNYGIGTSTPEPYRNMDIMKDEVSIQDDSSKKTISDIKKLLKVSKKKRKK